jgi:hypothetical protein
MSEKLLAGIVRTHARTEHLHSFFARIAYLFAHFLQGRLGRRVPLQKMLDEGSEVGVYMTQISIGAEVSLRPRKWVIMPDDLKLLSICPSQTPGWNVGGERSQG